MLYAGAAKCLGAEHIMSFLMDIAASHDFMDLWRAASWAQDAPQAG